MSPPPASRATLLLLADGRFPTGGHAHSGGVEAACGAGDIRSLADLARFLDGRLDTVGRVEAAFAAAACVSDDWQALDRAVAARTPSPRLRQVSRTLGRQLLRAGLSTWPSTRLDTLRTAHEDGPFQPIALGAVAASAGLTAEETALCALHHLVAAATTAGVRLLGLDPFGVATLAASLAPRLDALAALAASTAACDPDELPSTTGLLADILAEHHATWEVRLFAS